MEEQSGEVPFPPEVARIIIREALKTSIYKQKKLKRNRTLAIISGTCFTAIALLASAVEQITTTARTIDVLASIIGVCATWVASNNYKMLYEEENVHQAGMKTWNNTLPK